MAFDIANPIGTGTDEELLEFTRAAIARVTLNGTYYMLDGRQITFADLQSLRDQADWLEARINAAAGASRNKCNLARFKRPA